MGDILNPAMDRDEVKKNLPAVRRAELDSAAAIIGYDEVVMLGYRGTRKICRGKNRRPV